MYLRQFFRIQIINQLVVRLQRTYPVKPILNSMPQSHYVSCNRNYRTLFAIHNLSMPVDVLNVDLKSPIHFIQKRYKKKKAGKQPQRPSKQDEDDDDDEDEDEDSDQDELMDESDLDSRVLNTTVMTWRLDAFGKTCFNISRAKFEESFYNVSAAFVYLSINNQ